MTPLSVKILPFIFAVILPFVAACQPDPSQESDSLGQRARWHNNQGVVYMDQHNYTRGRDQFTRSVEIAPQYANGYANLGIAYHALGKFDSATTALETALALAPKHLHAAYTLGLIYHQQGRDYEQSLALLDKVMKADPDDPLVHYFIGQVNGKLGNSKTAITHFRRAIRLDPFSVSAHYALAQQFRQLDRQDEWRQTLEQFSTLQSAGHSGVSTSYQGQGKYAEAVIDAADTDPDRFDTQGPFSFAASPLPLRISAVIDSDNDGNLDLLAGDKDLQLLAGDNGSFSAPRPALSPPGETSFILRGDADNDGIADLVLGGAQTWWYKGDSASSWQLQATIAGPSQNGVFADVDHDGDLDLLLLGGDGTRLLHNDGQGNFADISQMAGIGGHASDNRAVFADFDNDRDIDFFIAAAAGNQLFTNNRDGTFTDIATKAGLAAKGGIDAVSADFDQDGLIDLCILAPDGELILYDNKGENNFTAASAATISGAKGLVSADLENDGDQDVAVFGDGIRLLAWHKGRLHLDEQTLAPDQTLDQVIVGDFDNNGSTDLIAGDQLLSNQATNSWIAIDVEGLNSNLDGIGTKIEVKTASRLQKREISGNSHDPKILSFGLADADSVEFIRILWPSGVRQTELAAPARQRLSLKELNRKGTSCPILYAWDGEEFRFVTDILGGGIIGYLTAPGEYYTPDSDEYVPLGKLVPRQGNYVLQLTNQLEEIIYLDAVELIAVDHPADVQVYPNERLLSAPPYPDFKPYPLRNLRPPKAALDHRGHDVLPQLSQVDDNWYEGFQRQSIHGYAEDFHLVLDLGDLSTWEHPVLLAYGWVDYAHSSSNWAAHQAGLTLYPPRLEVPDKRGGWKVVQQDMGCPAGLPKHMLVDLKDALTAGDYRIRIATNTAVFWDQFLIGDAADLAMETHRLGLGTSDLHWRGYPAHTSIKGTFAFRYHYDQVQEEMDWGTHSGAFTRYGAVDELLHEVDDRFVIMFHGDELTLQFDADALAPPAPGLERTFMLYADGFGKDMDFHSAHSLTVDPLPFHGMSSYPYPPEETYPLQEANLDYLLEYNTRWKKGHYE